MFTVMNKYDNIKKYFIFNINKDLYCNKCYWSRDFCHCQLPSLDKTTETARLFPKEVTPKPIVPVTHKPCAMAGGLGESL